MDRVYQANAIETPPSTTASSGSYPTAGNKAAGQLATVPGPYWFYSITEEIRNALIAAGVTPDAAKVNQLAEAMSKFLPLSGGTMTGAIVANGATFASKNGDDGYMRINGGSAWGKGASLELKGMSASDNAGQAFIRCTDGTNNTNLQLKPDGTALWGSKNLVRSVNGTTADASGNVAISGFESVNSSGPNWIRYESGLQICWGGVSYTSGGSVVTTLPVAFSNTSWRLSVITHSFYGLNVSTRTSTNFTLTTNVNKDTARKADYIAVGKWK